MMNFSLTGIEKLQAQADKLSSDKLIKQVIRTSLVFMQKKAKENLKEKVYSRPVDWERTGDSLNSIKIKGDRVVMDSEIGEILEYGTSPHWIFPKEGDVLAFEIGGELIFTPEVYHPGTPEFNFWRPAVRETERKSEEFLKEAINAMFI